MKIVRRGTRQSGDTLVPCTNLGSYSIPEHRRIAFAGRMENAAVAAPSAPVAGHGKAAGHADINANAKRWSDSHVVRAIIDAALVLAISKGLFSTFALAVVAPLAQLPVRDENSVFRVDMHFGVIVIGALFSNSLPSTRLQLRRHVMWRVI